MGRRRSCPDACSCRVPCCCGLAVSTDVGYFVSSFWLMLNGGSFPVVSFLFWPRHYIFYVCCTLCVLSVGFALVNLFNFFVRNLAVFRTVVYGVGAMYLSAGLFILAAVCADMKGNANLFCNSLKANFGVTVKCSATGGLLLTIQILYYFYLFVSYVYCGTAVQRYEMDHNSKYRVRGS